MFAAGSPGPGTAVLVALVPMRSQDFGFNRNQERLAAKIQATGNALRGDMPHLNDIEPNTGQIPVNIWPAGREYQVAWQACRDGMDSLQWAPQDPMEQVDAQRLRGR